MRSAMYRASAHGRGPARRTRGFSLLELMLAVGFVAVLAAVAVPSYTAYVDRVNVTVAVGDISRLQVEINKFILRTDRLPVDLAEAGFSAMRDPWNRPYEYLDLSTVHGHAGMRKDRNLVPINSDYDLYSAGKDGLSVPPLGARHSLDDIVRANDGAFVGLAEDY